MAFPAIGRVGTVDEVEFSFDFVAIVLFPLNVLPMTPVLVVCT